MEYKVLIKLFVPEIEEQYEAYIPINKTIYAVSNLLMELIQSHSKEVANKKHISLYNRYTNAYYDTSLVVRNTDIRNGSQLVAILEDATEEEKAKEEN